MARKFFLSGPFFLQAPTTGPIRNVSSHWSKLAKPARTLLQIFISLSRKNRSLIRPRQISRILCMGREGVMAPPISLWISSANPKIAAFTVQYCPEKLRLLSLRAPVPKDKRAALRTRRRLLRLRLPLIPRYNATSAWHRSPDLELR
jgi:hypothetical protein